MWVRGLKLLIFQLRICVSLVAPHVGAWIETREKKALGRAHGVAPHVGAWIETDKQEDGKEIP